MATQVLLVEDNEDDVLLTLTALKRVGLGSGISVCRDGEEALDYLFCKGAYAARSSAEQPRLILLDIKLPKVDGIEVARRVKSDPRTKAVSIVMLTSSSRQADISAAYNAGADHYLTKSVEFQRFTEDIARLSKQFLGSTQA